MTLTITERFCHLPSNISAEQPLLLHEILHCFRITGTHWLFSNKYTANILVIFCCIIIIHLIHNILIIIKNLLIIRSIFTDTGQTLRHLHVNLCLLFLTFFFRIQISRHHRRIILKSRIGCGRSCPIAPENLWIIIQHINKKFINTFRLLAVHMNLLYMFQKPLQKLLIHCLLFFT